MENTLDNREMTGTVDCREYRADCRIGQFKIGASELRGDVLPMEILSWRIFTDELFGYPRQEWLQLLFLDSEGIFSSILFKTESIENFVNLAVELAAKKNNFDGGLTTGSMAERLGISGRYYAVEFSWEPLPPERLEKIKAEAALRHLQVPKIKCRELDNRTA